MRTHLLLVLAVGLAATTMAATAPPNFPEVSLQPRPEDACFAAAHQLNSDPATCDDLIYRADLDTRTLAATHNNRGVILATIGLRDEALSDFEATLALVPDHAEAQINRANILFELARYPQALRAYDSVLAGTGVNQHVVLFNRALTHRALGNLEQAGVDFAAARERATGSAKAVRVGASQPAQAPQPPR